MKHLFRIILFLIISANARGAYVQVTHLTGTATYSGVAVTLGVSGSTGSGGGDCLITPTPYRTGGAPGALPGTRTFICSVPVYAVKLYCERIHNTEFIRVGINGVTYTLTAANVVTLTDCHGTYFCSISAGNLVGPATDDHSGATVTITSCTGINSFSVYCNGLVGGSTFYAWIDPVFTGCLTATNNGPVCAGDSLKLFAHGDSTGASYVWHGPGIGGPVVGTAQNVVIPVVGAGASGTYYVIRTVGTHIDTAGTDVVVKPLPVIVASSNSPICSGNTLTLTSTPDSVSETWVWSGPGSFSSVLSDPTRPAVAVTDSGTYKVVATFHGCKDSATVHVVVNPTPAIPVAGSNTPVCAGNTLSLTATDATAGVTYSWSGPSAFSSGVQNPSVTGATTAATGIYTVVVSTGSCTASATTAVTVNALPTAPVLGSNAPLCSGNSLNLTAASSVGATYSWAGPNSFTSALQNPAINPATTLATGTYSVIATLNGCTSARSLLNVVVDSTPVVPVVTNNGPLCSGDTLKLAATDATIGVSYNWSGPSAFTSTGQNPYIANVSTATSGTYTVTASLGSCSATATTVVVVNLTPVVPLLSSNSPVCSGNALVFTAISSAGATYHWSGPNAFSAAVSNPSINPATTAATGIYTVFATIGSCTSGTATIFAQVDSTPAMPSASSNSPGPPGASICEGDMLTLFANDATPGVTYSWSGPLAFGSTLQNPVLPGATPAMSGPYTVVVTLGVCTNAAVITVTVTPVPALSAGSNSPVCSGDTLKLTATSNAGAVFSWSGPYVFTSGAQNPIRYPATTEHSGVYVVTSLLNGCTATVFDTVIVNQTPEPPVMAWLTYCQYYNAWPLQAYGANVLWYPSGTSIAGSPVAPVPQTTVVGATFYYASQTVLGCTSPIDSMLVTVNPTPTINPVSSAQLCPHDTVRLGTGVTSGTATYRWYPAMYLSDSTGDTVVIRPETNVHYYVVAANTYNCKDTAGFDITVDPNAVLFLPDSVTIFAGESYQLNPQTNCSSFRWSPSGGLSSAYISNPIAILDINTRYVVNALTASGCSVSDTIMIYVRDEAEIVIPNAFAPGSGPNNEFKLIKRGIARLRHFRIYDRWGVVVFETNDIDKGWDGTYKNTPQPFGVYVYEYSAVTPEAKEFTRKGNVTLLR